MADGRSICGSDDDHVLLSKTALAKTAFQKLQRNVIINWYNKKQQTLSFQGPDGPSLRDNFVDLVQKKPGTTTDFQDPGPSVSTKQTTHPSLRETDGSQERTNYGKRAFCYSGALLCINMPIILRKSDSLGYFKEEIDQLYGSSRLGSHTAIL